MKHWFEIVWYRKVPFTTNKFVEFQTSCSFQPEFDVLFRFKTKGDHPGLKASIQIHKWYVGFTFYDSRHWDYENDRYESEYPTTQMLYLNYEYNSSCSSIWL